MLQLEFTTEAIDALRYERFHHPHPRVQLKMEVLWLKSQRLPHRQICQLAGISGNTLRAYLRDYQAGGIEQLKQLNFYQPQSALQAHRASLEAYFKEHPPVSAKQARAMIAEHTGLTRSPTQVRAFLLRLGMKCRKVGSIPAKLVAVLHALVHSSAQWTTTLQCAGRIARRDARSADGDQ